MNPIVEKSHEKFGAFAFDKINNQHFIPALDKALYKAREELTNITKEDCPTFNNTIEKLERMGRELGMVSGVFFNLNSAETNPEMESMATEFSQKLSEFHNEVALNEGLFKNVKAIFESKDQLKLNSEESRLLEKTFKSFARNGALLPEKEKEKIKRIDRELAELKVKFGQNVLAETNSYSLVLKEGAQLSGLPEDVISAARSRAEKKKEQGWEFNLQFPSYIPFMKYSDRRELREELFREYASRAAKDNENDNRKICSDIARLRKERAEILGYTSHAAYVLEERMAGSEAKVAEFIEELLNNSLDKAKEQVNEVSIFAAENGAALPLQKWDFSYWSEKLRKEKYQLNDELLKPYFVLENVLNGAFEVARRLYGLNFTETQDIPKYHEEVKTFEVSDENEQFVALFYADFFPREGKRAGAWMTSYKPQFVEQGVDHRPHVSIVCNFNRPVGDKPSLLTFQEVTTLFHEFGHALHGMCAKGKYSELSGTSVYWDFVELPSQLMENWCYEREALSLFAKHYETGELIPESYIEKIKESAIYLEGYQTIRQLSFGLLDLAWHGEGFNDAEDVNAFEKANLSRTALLPGIEGALTSPAFQHIFNGGYSAGYYSYKWAEVLDADAFEAFSDKGIFDKETAKAFKENILEKGGSEDPMILYKRFRGRDADPKALLRRAGLA